MPNYDYRCKACGHTWEQNVLIAQRDEVTEQPCTACGANMNTWTGDEYESPIERLAGAPGVSYSTAENLSKKTPNAFKDLLRNMKTKHRHNTINIP